MTTQYVVPNRSVTLFASALALFALLAIPGLVSAGPPVTDSDVAERIAQAKTKGDHQALATYFSAKAAEAGKTVELHEKMLASIKRWESGKSQAYHDVHCRALVRSARETQAEYKDLADEHARLAGEAAQ